MGKKIRFWIINKKNFLRLKINPFRRRKLWFQCHKNFLRMLSHYFSEYIQYIPFWGAIHHYCHKKSNWSWITCISFRLQKINPKLTDIFFVTTSESFFFKLWNKIQYTCTYTGQSLFNNYFYCCNMLKLYGKNYMFVIDSPFVYCSFIPLYVRLYENIIYCKLHTSISMINTNEYLLNVNYFQNCWIYNVIDKRKVRNVRKNLKAF